MRFANRFYSKLSFFSTEIIHPCPHPNPSLLLRKQYLSLRERYVSQRDKHCSRSDKYCLRSKREGLVHWIVNTP